MRDFGAANSDAEFLAKMSLAESVALQKSWHSLGDSLRQLPVSAVEDSFAVRVQNQIRSEQAGLVSSESSAPRPYNFGRAAALLATSCAVMLVAATIVAYQANARPTATSLAFRTHDPQQWEVVVVTVPEQRMQLVTAGLRDAVDQRGLQIHTLSEGQPSTQDEESLELLMASGASSVEFLEALSVESADVEAEWNPEQIAGFDRQELLNRFAESMQTPTQSDKFFGEVFVVLPKEHSIQVTSVPATQIAEAADRQIVHRQGASSAASSALQVADSVDAQVAELLDRKADRPVLVIFRKKPAPRGEIQGGMGFSGHSHDSV